MYALFCFTVGWIMFAILAQREPTLTAREGDKPLRVIYLVLLCQIVTAYAAAQMPTALGKIVIVILFEIATIDFWFLSKIARSRYIFAKVSYIRELAAKERGVKVWVIPTTVDFLVIPKRDGSKKKITIKIEKLAGYTNLCIFIAMGLMFAAIISRFIFTFPGITENMFRFFYAILVMSAAFAIALYDESTASKLVEEEKKHKLAMIRKRYPNVTQLTARQYELVTMAVFRDIYQSVFLLTFIFAGTLGAILTAICYAIIKYYTVMI